MERYIQDANFEEYFDFAQVTEAELEHLVAEGKIEPPGEGDPTFPARLNYMLDEVDTDGFGEVVSWQPHGRSFLIHNQKRFKEEVLPLWFRMTKIQSFTRQLNLYQFRRLTTGPDRGGHYHPLFLRGKRFLAQYIKRKVVKGAGTRKVPSPDTDPDFYSIPPLPMPTRPAKETTERSYQDYQNKVSLPIHNVQMGTQQQLPSLPSVAAPLPQVHQPALLPLPFSNEPSFNIQSSSNYVHTNTSSVPTGFPMRALNDMVSQGTGGLGIGGQLVQAIPFGSFPNPSLPPYVQELSKLTDNNVELHGQQQQMQMQPNESTFPSQVDFAQATTRYPVSLDGSSGQASSSASSDGILFGFGNQIALNPQLAAAFGMQLPMSELLLNNAHQGVVSLNTSSFSFYHDTSTNDHAGDFDQSHTNRNGRDQPT